MSKFIRAAQTSQSLSLAAMEEASRLGLRTADIEHLFLALVITDQSAGRALRSMGIDLDSARRAVEEQHEAQLASLGLHASFPEAGQIVFHETSGYEWSRRATDLITRSGGRGKAGDAAAVLRELVAEPSGMIVGVLDRLGTTPDAVLGQLDQMASPGPAVPAAQEPRSASGSTDTFVPASVEEVWAFLASPERLPEWEMSVGSIELRDDAVTQGAVWQGRALTHHPNGKPLNRRPRFHRRRIELVELHPTERIAWSLSYPDAPQSAPVVTRFALASTEGGTQVTTVVSWPRRGGWRGILALPLRPAQKLLVWITLFQIGAAISRAFR